MMGDVQRTLMNFEGMDVFIYLRGRRGGGGGGALLLETEKKEGVMVG